MPHVVLLGDSIFDNARYVPGHPPVIEQVRRSLPKGWTATLLAVDGHTTEDVAGQLAECPKEATHLVVSVGGNDALSESQRSSTSRARTVGEALAQMGEIRERFRTSYEAMLEVVRFGSAGSGLHDLRLDPPPGTGGADGAGRIQRGDSSRGISSPRTRRHRPAARLRPSRRLFACLADRAVGGGRVEDRHRHRCGRDGDRLAGTWVPGDTSVSRR